MTDTTAEIREQEAREQEAFVQQTEACITTNDAIRDPGRDKYASSLDTNNRDAWEQDTHRHFAWATPNWNDKVGNTEMWERCGEVGELLRRSGAGKPKPARDILTENEALLNNSLSERIKQHIVTLTSSTETIEGACRHCFGLYGEADSNDTPIRTAIGIWHTLCSIIGVACVYKAFLERAWHLNPTSPYFPERYRDIVDAVRASELDKRQRQSVHYADPYNQLELLNDTLKKLAYTFHHTDDPAQLAKLANSQVRVAGALHVINEKLDRTHENAIFDAQRRALNP